MTRRFLLMAALVSGTTAAAFGQFQFGPQIGLDLSDSDIYLGANAVFDLPWELGDVRLKGNPEFYVYLLDDQPGFDQSFSVLALNVLYPLDLDFANTYLGGGLILGMYSTDFRNPVSGETDFDDTDVGLLAKIGADFGKMDSKIVPWTEAGLHIVDGGGLWIQGGARVSL